MAIWGTEERREFDKEKLKELAFMDELTSLYNRRYLYQYLPGKLRDTKTQGENLSLFMMDVDTFKEINDTYGHLCGDKILVEIADILRRSFREGDTVIRYAGDEFVAVLPGTKEQVAVSIAKRIIDKISDTTFKESEGKSRIHVTISIGLAVFPRDAKEPERLIYQADQALYSSKRRGRNHICTIKDIPEEILDEAKIREIFPTPRLIGRDEQLNRLKDLLNEAEKGTCKFALIKGERGIGKSRLLEELKKFAELKGVSCINTTCSPEISRQPYQILIRALENLFSSLGPEVREFIRSLPEAQVVQLANYIPVLRKFLPEDFKVTKAIGNEQAQVDLFKGICQSLIYIVKRNTLLLTIDDFHWIDKKTLQLFDYMIKKLQNTPIFIAVCLREQDLNNRTEETSLKELFLQMQQDKSAEEISLDSLEKDDVLKMITTVFSDMKINQNFIDIVYNVSAGNPLFTEQVLRTLANKGFIFYQDGRWQARKITESALPPFLKETIQKMYSELDEETKSVISAAAVIGEVFNFDVLCQLLDKDPGYILEIIDRAARQNLVGPESPFQTDKFKFNSGIIRDVIYADLALQNRQDLHRRLALIEENNYKDNIDSVAGNLGYHFEKAKVKDKADFYANLLLKKTSRMPTYEDVFGYLQEALLERVEEVVVPLSDASIKLIPSVIRSLRLATHNVRLYPPQSAIRQDFVNQAYKYLKEILDKDNTLIISTAENRLLVNGEEIGDRASRQAGAGAFIALMIDQRVKSIAFKKDLTKEELSIFLEGLGQSFDDLISAGGLSGLLRKKEVLNIKVNEVRYEQTTRLTKQRTKFEDAMLIDYLIGKVSNIEGDKDDVVQFVNDPKKLGEALKKVAEAAKVQKGEDKTQAQANIIAKSLQKLSDQVLSQTKGGIDQYRKNIAQAMMALDYKLRSKLIESQIKSDKVTTDKTGPRDVIKDAIHEFSDEEIIDMVGKEYSDSKGDLANIRKFLRRFLLEPKRKQALAPKLKSKLTELGMNEEEVSWALEEDLWKGLSLEKKTERLINIPADTYVKLEMSKQVGSLISQLLESDQYNQANKIIDKLLRQLDDKSKQVRSATINDLDKIAQILISKEKYFLVEQIINSLITRLDEEKDPQVYSLVAQLLATICAALIKKQNFIQATGILSEFNHRLDEKSRLLDIQKNAIREAKEKTVATHSLVQWLTKLLESKIENHQDFYELSKVIGELGYPTIGPLFALGISKDPYIDPFKTYALRWSIAKVLKSMGEAAVLYLKDKLSDKRPEVIKATLETLGHMQNKAAVKYLHPLLKHEDLEVRKETITTLGKIGGEESIKSLSESIKDRNNEIRLASVWALANIGNKQVIPLLKPLLNEKKIADEVKRIIQRIKRR